MTVSPSNGHTEELPSRAEMTFSALRSTMKPRMIPTRKKERFLWAAGNVHVAGLDEAGRGAWAGPLVAAAVILPRNVDIPGLRDSKLLSPKRREQLYELIADVAVAWAIGIVEVDELDRCGAGIANCLALQRAANALIPTPHHLLVDGRDLAKFSVPHTAMIDGDAKELCIAAASVVAKVTRDRMMIKLHGKFPLYGFDRHKGYGVAAHAAALRRHGPALVHRMSFAPIRSLRTPMG